MKKSIVSLKAVIVIISLLIVGRGLAEDIKPLAIGSPAPEFRLKGVDGKWYTLESFKKAELLVIVFTCNHCPTAQAYEDRLISISSDYASRNVQVVAINPNDPNSLRLDELDFSDIGDSYEEMKIRAKEKDFKFPYLYDGDSQKISKQYGPVATPHVFIFDKQRKLRYQGRVDDMESPFKTPRSQDTRNAIDALLAGHDAPVQTTKVFGCSIKWTEKSYLVQQFKERWAKEPVSIQDISGDQLRDIFKNPSDKLRLIYCWNVSGKADTANFPDFVSINRMYRDRDFEFISINTNNKDKKEDALTFLQRQQASNLNYQPGLDGKQLLAGIVEPPVSGKLPYTLLIEPGGKIVYTKEGPINPAALKSTIVNNHLIGKYP